VVGLWEKEENENENCVIKINEIKVVLERLPTPDSKQDIAQKE
jgi:hypothetical protein